MILYLYIILVIGYVMHQIAWHKEHDCEGGDNNE